MAIELPACALVSRLKFRLARLNRFLRYRAVRVFGSEKMAEESQTSWLKSITGGVIGAGALTLIKDYIEKQGGLGAVVKNFQNAGFKRQVDSWISTGKNEVISGIEVGQAIGIEKLKKLAEASGVDVNKARDLLAEYLPIAIDKATPEGKLPSKDKTA
jgi:uncharacterized protein YidB (DUF937 family)